MGRIFRAAAAAGLMLLPKAALAGEKSCSPYPNKMRFVHVADGLFVMAALLVLVAALNAVKKARRRALTVLAGALLFLVAGACVFKLSDSPIYPEPQACASPKMDFDWETCQCIPHVPVRNP